MADTYTLHIAGLTRELPICKVNDHMENAALIMFSDDRGMRRSSAEKSPRV